MIIGFLAAGHLAETLRRGLLAGPGRRLTTREVEAILADVRRD